MTQASRHPSLTAPPTLSPCQPLARGPSLAKPHPLVHSPRASSAPFPWPPPPLPGHLCKNLLCPNPCASPTLPGAQPSHEPGPRARPFCKSLVRAQPLHECHACTYAALMQAPCATLALEHAPGTRQRTPSLKPALVRGPWHKPNLSARPSCETLMQAPGAKATAARAPCTSTALARAPGWRQPRASATLVQTLVQALVHSL